MIMSSVPMRLRNSIGVLAMGLLVLALTTGSARSATRFVSGYLSGLNRGESVTLLQNGVEALTVTTNGIFNFATPLASGAAYEVTVGAQPVSEVCTVDAGGSGSVPEAGVTQVQVSCASSTETAPAATTGWWIPYIAYPQKGTTGGLTGLFLIASNLIHDSPTQQFIATTPASIIGEGVKITAAGLAGAQPMNMMYSAVGTDGNTHIYGVPVNNTAAVPTPAQITNLSLASTQTICGKTQAQTSLTNAATLFVVLNVSTAPCGANPSTFYVVHYKDTPTTKPKKVSISTTQISTLYNNGVLVGLYLYDAATKSLNYYASDAFASPTKLVTSVAGVTPIAGTATIANGTTFGATVFFPAVAGVTASGNALYSIESTSPSTVTLIHKGTVSQGVVDNANLYFQDTSSSTAAVFYQVGLTAATPMELYSGSVIPSLSSYTLIGTDTVHLAFMESVVAPTSQATISTIPIGVLSTTPTAIAGPYNGNVFEPFLAAPKANDWAANKLFLTILQFTAGPPVKYTYSSTATALSAIAPTPKKNSAYESLGTGSVWQAKGITDTDGGLGGASMNLVNVTTLADSALTTTGGLAYHIPAHYNGILVELGSAKIGFGALGSTVSTQPEVGLACDVAGKFIIEVTDTNTNVVY